MISYTIIETLQEPKIDISTKTFFIYDSVNSNIKVT